MGKYNSEYSGLAAMNMVEEDGRIWMALLNRNGICEVDKVTRRAKIRKVFDGEALTREFLYGKAEKVGDNLVFAPWYAENIAIYNFKKNAITYIPLNERPQKLKESSREAKFWNIMSYQSDVYLLGYSYPAIIKINMISFSIEYIVDWVEEIEDNINVGDENGYFGDGYVIVNDCALFPIGCMKAVLELNLKTADTSLRKLDVSMEGIGGIGSADQEHMWLVGRGNHTNWLSCWNIRTDEIKEIQIAEENGNIRDPFYPPLCIGSKVLLIPLVASCAYEMTIDTWEIMKRKEIEVSVKEQKVIWPWWKTMAPRLQGGKLYFITSNDLGWHEYDVVTREHESYFVVLEEETEKYLAETYKEHKEKKAVIPEIKIPLEYFLEKVRKSKEDSSKGNGIYFIGEEIYDRIRRGI